MTTLATYPPHGEDKYIIAERSRLESFWRNSLTDDQRAAWNDYWQTSPPVDIFGRHYVPATPLAWNELRLPLATVYAWQQIYATYRFHDAPTTEPVDPAPLEITSIIANAATASVVMQVNFTTTPPAGTRLLLYASQVHSPLHGDGRQRVRPITWLRTDDASQTFDVTDAYLARWGTPKAGIITFSAATLDDNNGLAPALIYTNSETPAL